MEGENHKQCSYCKEVKPHSEYFNNLRTNDRKDNYCKVCRTKSTKGLLPKREKTIGKELHMEDFYPPAKKWEKLKTWNKYDVIRFDELLYNGGDITEAFHMKVYDKIEWEKNNLKKKKKWGS